MTLTNRKPVAVLAIALLLSACAVGPDFTHPAAPGVNGYTDTALPDKTAAADVAGGAAQRFVAGRDIPSDWWTLFASKPLDDLIAQALKANPDLQAAEASLRQARENLYAGEGALFPAVDINGGATREKFSPAAFGNSGAPASIFTLYNASVSVSYGIDIFGGERREIEELKALAGVQRAQRDAAYIALTANVVTAAVQEASVKAQVQATQDIVNFDRKQLDILQEQFKAGAIPEAAVLAQKTALAQQQATLPPLENQLSQLHTELAVLTGHFSGDKLDDDFDLATLHLPQELPVSLPSALVEQRPDILAAEAQLHAASAAIGVATANMLPQVTLTGSYGWETVSSNKLFSPSTNVWNIGAGLLQPVLRGGELWHERKAAVAAYDQAAAQYRSTVLKAFKNVADSLRALQFDADALAARDNAARAASDSLNLAQAQFKAGAISYLSLLDAERAYAEARVALVQAAAARFADTAALFEALGGGWWSKNPVNGEAMAQDQANADRLCTFDPLNLPPPIGGRLGGGHSWQCLTNSCPRPNPSPIGEGIDPLIPGGETTP